jgi:hypothetical protein
MEEEKFDFEAYKKEAVHKLLDKEPGTSMDKLMKPLVKQILATAAKSKTKTPLYKLTSLDTVNKFFQSYCDKFKKTFYI